jgi:hypothetical protein
LSSYGVVASRYLATAEAAGLLADIDGVQYVAGDYQDPVSDERLCFVEYCDSTALSGRLLQELSAVLLARFPRAEGVMLRAPGNVQLAGPWQRRLTYVRYTGGARQRSSDVLPATPDSDDQIFSWLEQAVVTGYAQQGWDVGEKAATAVGDLMSRPDRVSYVYFSQRRVAGHITLLKEAYDDVTDEYFLELVDLLAAPSSDTRAVTGKLVDAAAAAANDLDLPLVGNVVHPTTSDDEEVRDRVLTSLLRRSWIADHAMWWAPRGMLGHD